MGSILSQDKIGNISKSGTDILLNELLITLGGRQYFGSGFTKALPTLAENTLYRVYAVLNPTLQLVIDSRPNSLGPTGFNRWKLVGAFYTDQNANFVSFFTVDDNDKYEKGIGGVEFKAILNITGESNWITDARVTFGKFIKNGDLWWLNFNIRGIVDSATRNHYISYIDGVIWKFPANISISGSALHSGANVQMSRVIYPDKIECYHDSYITDTYSFSGNIALDSKPTKYVPQND